MHASRIINLVFMYRKILTLLSLLYTKPAYVHVLANLFLLTAKKKRKLKLKKALDYINNDRAHTGIQAYYYRQILCNLPGYRTIPAPFQTVKIGTVTVFFYIVKIFNNIFTTLN